jgi:hypothetical protein
MRHSVANRSTVVGTTLRAIASLFGTASVGLKLREVGIFNTTSTASAVALVRFTNATGVGSALTKTDWDAESPAICSAYAGHTADGAVGAAIRQASLPAAVGGGVIWTFGDSGLIVPKGTANGIGIIVPTGTGQIVDFYYDWDE